MVCAGMEQTEKSHKVFFLIDGLLLIPGIKIIAIDGNAAAGKSSLTLRIAEKYDCNVFHTDDFFLPPDKKTEQRLKEAGGNMDRERLAEEVLDKIRRHRTFSYRRYDCKLTAFLPPTLVSPKRLNIVEGVYSLHPDLIRYYDLKIFLSLNKEEQFRRILHRSGAQMYKRFIEEWIPLEDRYFTEFNIKEDSDICIDCFAPGDL